MESLANILLGMCISIALVSPAAYAIGYSKGKALSIRKILDDHNKRMGL